MSITTLNLGKIRLNWKGPWAQSTAYVLNDAVSYGGSSYVCIQSSTSSSSFTTDLAAGAWQIMAQGASVNTTQGDITYHGATQDARLGIGNTGQVLTVGSNGLPQWGNPNEAGAVYYVSKNGSDTNNGTSINTAFLTLRKACDTVTGPATIYVKAGVYAEKLPITVPANVTIIGDGMRDTEITPLTGSASSTYTASGSSGTTLKVASTTGILAGMTVTGTGFTSGQKVSSVTNSTTLVLSGNPDVTPSGTLTFRYLSTDASPVVNNLSTMFYLSDSTMLQNILMTGMTGFTPSGGAPTDITAATIGGVYLRLNPATTITVKSPYVKDCTAKSTGGVGAIVDGTSQSGGLTSMVFWAYNIVMDGGVGIWAKDGGKIEAVSVFTYYCYFGYITTGGGLIRSLSGNNSYGTYGAVSSGYLASETPVTGNVYGGMITFNSATATGTFQQGETITQATSGATGIITSVQTGYLYYKSTSGTFNTTNLVTGGTSGATTTPTAVGGQNNYILVLSSLSAAPVAGASIQFGTGDTNAYVISAVSTATVNSTSLYIITLAQQKVVASNDGVVANIRYNFSLIRLQGHDFLYIGTGGVATTNYPGIPSQSADPAKQITYTFPGRVYYVATDEKGNFNVGQYFSVNQATGSATLNASAFNLSGLTSLRLGSIGAQLGAQVDEFSTDVTLSQNSATKVPTQSAVTGYLGAAYQNISPATDTVVTTATASSGNNITVGTTTGMVRGMTAVFGSNMGNLVAQTVYYILTASGTTITVSTVPNGSAFSVGTTTGQSVALNTGYSLGTANKRWSHVYVGPGSITIGSLTISDNAGTLQVQASGANAPANINAINNGTSNVTVANNGDITITAAGTLNTTFSGANVTHAGDIAVNGGDITTTSTTATLYDTTATTVYLGRAATTLTMGANGSGTTTIRNDVTIGGSLTVNGANFTSTSTNTAYTDSLIELNYSNGGTLLSDNGKDIGIRFHYYKTTDKNAALVLGNDSSQMEFYVTGTETTGVFSGTYGVFKGAGFNYAGSGSGTTLVQASATASGTLTLPAASDTLVGKATTDTLTNKTYDTAGTGNTFKINGTTVSAVTGSGAVVLATSPAIATSLTTASTSFDLINTTATTVNFAGGATTLAIGASTGTATINNPNLTLAGGLYQANAQYLYSKNSTGTQTRTFGINGSNALYIGGIDTALSGGIVFANSTTMMTLDSSGNLVTTGNITAGPNTANNTITINGNGVSGTATLASNVTTGAVNIFTGTTTGTVTIGSAAAGKLTVAFNSASTSTSTGSLVVTGGVGVGGSVYATTIYENTARVATMGKSIAMSMVFG
jgi:hypothetical protein